jgi:hydrogenase maturation protease
VDKQTAVLGFGNPVRSDDGIGPYVIEQLRLLPELPPQVSLFDMGTSAFEVLFKVAGHERLIIVDAVLNTGEPAGTLYRLPAEAVAAAVQDDPMVFLHSLKWNQALSYAKKILRDQYPDDITVYLIAVDDTHLDVGLSAVVRAAGDQVTEHIRHACLAPEELPPLAQR